MKKTWELFLLLFFMMVSLIGGLVYAESNFSAPFSSSENNEKKLNFNLSDYETKIELDKQALEFYNTGYNYFSKGKYKEAIDYFNQALEIYPNQTLYLLKKGDSLFNLGEYEESLAIYEHAYTSAPGGNPKKLAQDGIAKVNKKMDQLISMNINNPDIELIITPSPDSTELKGYTVQNQNFIPGFESMYISKHINETDGKPYELCTLFNWSDNKVENRVYSSLQFKSLNKTMNFEWLWYDPTGKLVLSTKNTRKAGSNFAYAYIKARNQRVGEWTVEVKVDNTLIDSAKFMINNSNPSQSIDCLGNTICGDKCCMGGNYGCCHTKDGDKCFDADVAICVDDQYGFSKISGKY